MTNAVKPSFVDHSVFGCSYRRWSSVTAHFTFKETDPLRTCFALERDQNQNPKLKILFQNVPMILFSLSLCASALNDPTCMVCSHVTQGKISKVPNGQPKNGHAGLMCSGGMVDQVLHLWVTVKAVILRNVYIDEDVMIAQLQPLLHYFVNERTRK